MMFEVDRVVEIEVSDGNLKRIDELSIFLLAALSSVDQNKINEEDPGHCSLREMAFEALVERNRLITEIEESQARESDAG